MIFSNLSEKLLCTIDTNLSDSLNIGTEIDEVDSIVVNYGDGSDAETFHDNTSQATHNYATNGEYTIEANGLLSTLIL